MKWARIWDNLPLYEELRGPNALQVKEINKDV
jgi:hypothetical protein